MYNPFSAEQPQGEMPRLNGRDFIKREIANGSSPEAADEAWNDERKKRLAEADSAFTRGVKTPRQAAPPEAKAPHTEAPKPPPKEKAPQPETPPSGGYHGWIKHEMEVNGKTRAAADASWPEELLRRRNAAFAPPQPTRAARTPGHESGSTTEKSNNPLIAIIIELRDLLIDTSGNQATQKLGKARLLNLFKTIHPDVHSRSSEAEQKFFKELSPIATEILKAYMRPQEVSPSDKTEILKQLEELKGKK